MKYSTIIKQVFVVLKTNWFKQFIKGKIFSIASYEVVTNLKNIVPKIDSIIDVGANSGQFTKVASHFYPDANISVFEPLPNLYPKIEKQFRNNENIITFNTALGNQDGTIQFNQNNFGHISSILDISEANNHYPQKKNDLNKIEVKIQKLDTLINTINTNGISLIKLDVQGFELEVLKGGINTIKNINYIIIEANLEQLYNDQPTFTKINSFLNSESYELVGMLDFNLGLKNKYIEIDLLYKNNSK